METEAVQQLAATLQRDERVSSVVTKLTLRCFDKCVSHREGASNLTTVESSCITNCALGNVESSSYLIQALQDPKFANK